MLQDEIVDCMAMLRAEGVPFVVATVIGTRGPTPRKIGAKMVVAADGRTFGTVGGGAVESKVIEKAKALLLKPEVQRFEWRLASEEAGGMHCGGAMEFLLEPFGIRPKAVIFGAGHVGRALNHVLNFLGFDVTIVDQRQELLTSDRLPGAKLVCARPCSAAESLNIEADSFCVVVNPSHTEDFETMKVLIHKPLRYLGLMASRKKKKDIFEALVKQGVAEAALERVHCPVGLDIGAETPEEIAVSVAAEMVLVLRGAKGGVTE